MAEPKREGRLDRLERMIADAVLTVRTMKDAFEQDRTHARRERQELRGKVERVIAKQNKAEATLDRVETDLQQLAPKVDGAIADVATLTVNQAGLRADVGEIKPIVAKEVIKQHQAEGARALWKKQWAVLVVVAGIIVWLIGEIRDWWPKLLGK